MTAIVQLIGLHTGKIIEHRNYVPLLGKSVAKMPADRSRVELGAEGAKPRRLFAETRA